MKTKQLITWTFLLSFLLMLGGCYTLMNIPHKQLNQAGLHEKDDFWITGIYLKDGTYWSFQLQSHILRDRYGLPEGYKGPVIVGDTLYGLVTISRQEVAIPTNNIKHLDIQTDEYENSWIAGVFLEDGRYIHPFEKESPELNFEFGLSEDYKGPIMVSDTLYGVLLSQEILSIPLENISTYNVHTIDDQESGRILLRIAGVAALVGIIVYAATAEPPCVFPPCD